SARLGIARVSDRMRANRGSTYCICDANGRRGPAFTDSAHNRPNAGRAAFMTRSMTGFARCEHRHATGVLTWELRAVNHRYSEIVLRLPEELRAIEPGAREL